MTTTTVDKDPLTPIRIVDFCAGLGGFHHGVDRALKYAIEAGRLPASATVECVAAAELSLPLRQAYVRNFPHTRRTYPAWASQDDLESLRPSLSEDLQTALPMYDEQGNLTAVHGDLSIFLDDDERFLRTLPNGAPLLPEHDLLCAGFPCQPFSKSGYQKGFEDTRGTVFHKIATILECHKPDLLFLENVGNFPRHDEGNTWKRVREVLEKLDYELAATEPRAMGLHATGLLSPHQYGYPHHRERFFLVGQLKGANPSGRMAKVLEYLLSVPLSKRRPFRPPRDASVRKANVERAGTRLKQIVSVSKPARTAEELSAARLSGLQGNAIAHWAKLIEKLAEHDAQRLADGTPAAAELFVGEMPSFPIWGYELDPWHWYPLEQNPGDFLDQPQVLATYRNSALEIFRNEVWNASEGKTDVQAHPPSGPRAILGDLTKPAAMQSWVRSWPGYAGKRTKWPKWKIRFLQQNLDFSLKLWSQLDPGWLRSWLDELYCMPSSDGGWTPRPASHQKLEWNAKAAPLDLWSLVAQLRPSGIRVKRPTAVPALVAMTTTQIPLVSTELTGEPRVGPTPHFRHIHPEEALQLQGFPATWDLQPLRYEEKFRALGNAVHAGLVGDVFAAWWFDLDSAVSAKAPAQQLRLV